MPNKIVLSFALILTCFSMANATENKNKVQSLLEKNGVLKNASSVSNLSQNEIITGLKEALHKGIENAVANLGKTDGFLKNKDVKIPLPKEMQRVETLLKTLKQEKLAEDFIKSMNRAAEQAVPTVKEVFVNTLQKMSLDDAKKILQGPDDAATQFFKNNNLVELTAQVSPLVKTATDKNEVTKYYKKAVSQAGPLGEKLLSKEALNLDQYVTTKALDGLFLMIAQEEKKIRQDPLARTTNILQKIFGK